MKAELDICVENIRVWNVIIKYLHLNVIKYQNSSKTSGNTYTPCIWMTTGYLNVFLLWIEPYNLSKMFTTSSYTYLRLGKQSELAKIPFQG